MESVTCQPVTSGPRFHFFGYYDKTPWDAGGRYLLALEASFMDRRPSPDDRATVGMVDLQDGNRWLPLGETRAWNWQQGSMLQWRPGTTDEILYNDQRDGRFVGIVLNVHTGAERILEQPIYGVSPNGREAVSLNFSRLFDVRPGYGYAGVADPWANELCPDDDGLYHVDLETGKATLILSLAQARELTAPKPFMDVGKHRFNHAQFAPDGSRFAVLHRWSVPGGVGGGAWRTRLLTMGPHGEDPYVLSDDDMISHYDWRDGETVLAWARRAERGDHYYEMTDHTQEARLLGDGVLTVDGHCSYSPDRKTILTDTYPDKEGYRTLLLVDPVTERRLDIGRFHGPTPPDGEIRCDLHPRWNRDGTQVCIDSIHENGQRQVYVLNVAEAIQELHHGL